MSVRTRGLVILIGALGCRMSPASAPRQAVPSSDAPNGSSPVASVERMLSDMRARDTASLRRLFHPGMRVATALERDGGTVLTLGADELIAAVGRATGPLWDQRLVRPQLRSSAGLASVWSEYVFFRGTTLDHCGVLAVHLGLVHNEWTVLQMADTHRSSGCESVAR